MGEKVVGGKEIVIVCFLVGFDLLQRSLPRQLFGI